MRWNKFSTTVGIWLFCNTLGFCQFGTLQRIHADGIDVKVERFRVHDLNDDGIDDVVLGIAHGIMYSIGNGDGTFADPQFVDSLHGPYALLYVGDVTGDGLVDLLYDAPPQSDSTQIILRQGTGPLAFGPEQQIVACLGKCVGFEVADLDNDGDLDLAFATRYATGLPYPFQGSHCLGWSENDGGSQWNAISLIQSSSQVILDVALVDIDNDGDDDLVSAGLGYLNVWRVDGGGYFTSVGNITSEPVVYRACLGADVDGDGDQDIIARTDEGSEIFMNDGSGGYTATIVIPTPVLVAGDMDNDGDIDVGNETKWYENDGTGNFALVHEIWARTPNTSMIELTLSDVNGDGTLDQLVCSSEVNLDLVVNPGSGPVGPPVDLLPRLTILAHETIGADVDLDGLSDVIVNASSRGFVWFRALANGGFDGPRPICRTEGVAWYSSILDIDNDGDTDVIYITDAGERRIMLTRNDGAGGFSTPMAISSFQDQSSGIGVAVLAGGDVDGDGDIDLITRRQYGSYYWHPNDGAANFGDSTLMIAATPPTWITTLVDLNNDGAIDLVSLESVTYINEYGQYESGLPIYMNDGFGNLALQDTLPKGIGYGGFTFHDIDQDGNMDMVVNRGVDPFEPKIAWIRNEGNGNWSMPISILSDPSQIDKIINLHFADVDGDGIADLLFNRRGSLQSDTVKLQIMKGLGGANFDLPRTIHVEPTHPIMNPINFGTAYTTAALDSSPPLDLLFQINRRSYWVGNFSNTPYQISGHVFHDTNGNAVRDTGEQPMPLVQVHFEPTNEGAFSYSNGQYVVYAQEGTYNLDPTSLLDPALWQATTPTAYEVTLTADDPVSTANDFGYAALVDTSIIQMEFLAPTGPCGGNASFWFNYDNAGTRIENGTLAIHFDPLSVPQQWTLFPAPTLVEDTTFYWDVADLGIMEHRSIHGTLPIPFWNFSGDTLSFAADIYLEDQAGTVTDTLSSAFSWVLGCAYDPNDKNVTPKGFGEYGAIPMTTDHLTYTIRFQNTGTGIAYNVVLKDQIPDDLEIGSMQVVGFSHQPSQVSIDADRNLTVRFLNIMLPDSGADFSKSQGFITFRIMVEEGLSAFTQISNAAEIYFDSNPPIITNSTLNTLVDCGLWLPEVSNPLADVLQATEGISYQWFFNDVPISGAVERLLTIDQAGNFSVSVTSIYGCVATSAPYSVITLAVAEMDHNVLTAVPNPFKTGTTLYSPMPIGADQTVLISDMEGRIIRSMRGNGSRQLEIHKNELAVGIYTVRLMLESGVTQSTLRLVVE